MLNTEKQLKEVCRNKNMLIQTVSFDQENKFVYMLDPVSGPSPIAGHGPITGPKFPNLEYSLLTSSCWWYSKVDLLYILGSMFVTLLDEICLFATHNSLMICMNC